MLFIISGTDLQTIIYFSKITKIVFLFLTHIVCSCVLYNVYHILDIFIPCNYEHEKELNDKGNFSIFSHKRSV